MAAPEEKSGDRSFCRGWTPGTTILGDYVIQRILGQGGMGTVYLVERVVSPRLKFAVKTLHSSRISDSDRKRGLLHELRTWIDLPDHPNIVACRFFRTVHDRLAIFSEFVQGGSLDRRIDQGQLRSAEQILDIAIQCCHGLQIAHSRGVVHQDIKPGNILISETRLAKITDFGLAGVRTGVVTGDGAADPELSAGVSSRGMTLAYCSPEQAAGWKVTRKTDIWSLGVTILHMFTGHRTWRVGAMANHILETFIRHRPDPQRIAIPDSVADILRVCFREDPGDRWPDMTAMGRHLEAAFAEMTSRVYTCHARDLFSIADGESVQPGYDDHTVTTWIDPSIWLSLAGEVAGHAPDRTECVREPTRESPRARAIFDLEQYERAVAILEDRVRHGETGRRRDLAGLCLHKGRIHAFLDDTPGALISYDSAVELLSEQWDAEAGTEHCGILIDVYKAKARLLISVKRYGEAVSALTAALEQIDHMPGFSKSAEGLACRTGLLVLLANAYRMNTNYPRSLAIYDQALAIKKSCAGPAEAAPQDAELAFIHLHRAISMSHLGNLDESIPNCDTAIRILENLAAADRLRFGADLAESYLSKTTILAKSGDLNAAMELSQRAIDILEEFVHVRGRRQLTEDLAKAYANQAVIFKRSSKFDRARPVYDRAISLLEHLVVLEGRSDLLETLAKIYSNTASTLRFSGDLKAALDYYGTAEEYFTHLILREHRLALRDPLSGLLFNIANTHMVLADYSAAETFHRKAIDLLKELMEQDQRRDLLLRMSWFNLYLAVDILELGRLEESRDLVESALPIMDSEIQRTGRKDLSGELDYLKGRLTPIIELMQGISHDPQVDER